MCYPKPGPRCATHTRNQLRAAENRRVNETQKRMDGINFTPEPGLSFKIWRLKEEYDETLEGQDEIAAQINAAEIRGDQDKAAFLSRRLNEAQMRRKTKKEAHDALHKENDQEKSDHILRFGPETGWAAGLVPEDPSEEDQDHGVSSQTYCSNQSMLNVWESVSEEEDYNEQRYTAVSGEIRYATPARPGPIEGSYIIGNPRRGPQFIVDPAAGNIAKYDPVRKMASSSIKKLDDKAMFRLYDSTGLCSKRPGDEGTLPANRPDLQDTQARVVEHRGQPVLLVNASYGFST